MGKLKFFLSFSTQTRLMFNALYAQPNEVITNAKPISTPISLATDKKCLATVVGTSYVSTKYSSVVLQDAICVQSLKIHLISAERLSNDTIKKGRFYISRPTDQVPRDIIMSATKLSGNTFRFENPIDQKHCSAATIKKSLNSLHDTFAHANPQALKRILNSQPQPNSLVDTKDPGKCTCSDCALTKIT